MATAKSADAARKAAMTKTVVKKVSPNVKIIKAGSRPLTQSASQKAAMVKKAKDKTPAVRAKTADQARANARSKTAEQGRMRQSIMNTVYRDALKAAGYNTNARMSSSAAPTAAQIKAANKAVAAAEKKLADGKKAARFKEAVAKATSGNFGKGGGLRGGGIGGNPFGKID